MPTNSQPDGTNLYDDGANLSVDFSREAFESSNNYRWSTHDPGDGGAGFWSVSVPEPSTQTLLFTGAVSGIIYLQGRKRWRSDAQEQPGNPSRPRASLTRSKARWPNPQ